MPTEQATTTGAPSASSPDGDGDALVAEVRPRDGGGHGRAARRSPMRAGLGDEAGAQPALGHELVERVAARRPTRRWARTISRTRASWSIGARRRGASRSAPGRPGPRPTSSSGPSSGVAVGARAVHDAGDLEPERPRPARCRPRRAPRGRRRRAARRAPAPTGAADGGAAEPGVAATSVGARRPPTPSGAGAKQRGPPGDDAGVVGSTTRCTSAAPRPIGPDERRPERR